MKNSLRLGLIVLALLSAVGLTIWLTGYREVPDEPGRACLARRIDGVVPLTSGTTTSVSSNCAASCRWSAPTAG